jgi:hypothetical protein
VADRARRDHVGADRGGRGRDGLARPDFRELDVPARLATVLGNLGTSPPSAGTMRARSR